MSEMSLAEAVVITSWISDDDYVGLIKTANDIKANVEDLILVLITESQMKPNSMAMCPKACGGSPAPRIPYIVAVGLNQITGSTAVANGWLEKTGSFQDWAKDFSKKKFQEQLPFLVQYFQNNAWFKAGKSYENALRIYLANAASGMIFADLKGNAQIYGGSAAKSNPERASIDQLRGGLAFTKANDPIWAASLVRLKYLGTNQMKVFLGLPSMEL